MGCYGSKSEKDKHKPDIVADKHKSDIVAQTQKFIDIIKQNSCKEEIGLKPCKSYNNKMQDWAISNFAGNQKKDICGQEKFEEGQMDGKVCPLEILLHEKCYDKLQDNYKNYKGKIDD